MYFKWQNEEHDSPAKIQQNHALPNILDIYCNYRYMKPIIDWEYPKISLSKSTKICTKSYRKHYKLLYVKYCISNAQDFNTLQNIFTDILHKISLKSLLKPNQNK